MVRFALMCLVLLGVHVGAWAQPAGPESRGHPAAQTALEAWYALKSRLAEEYDLNLSVAYSALYMQANKSAPDPVRSAERGFPVVIRRFGLL